MDKELFVKLLDAIVEYYQLEETYAELFFKLYGEYPVDRANQLVESVLEVLDDFAGFDLVSWWLFDAPNGAKDGVVAIDVLKDKGGNNIDVTTPGKLYDYVANL